MANISFAHHGNAALDCGGIQLPEWSRGWIDGQARPTRGARRADGKEIGSNCVVDDARQWSTICQVAVPHPPLHVLLPVHAGND